MAPSVRVKRRHVYTSIQDDDRYQPEHLADDQLDGGRRALSEGGAPLSTPPPPPPHDTPRLSANYPFVRRDTSRVNRVVRSGSIGYRPFSADLDSNLSNSPPATFGRLNNILPPPETILEGTSADVVVPAPQRGHVPRVSRVRSALSSSPSRTGRESSSDDSDFDSDDEDHVMEDDEHHHDDDVVDHLDVIGTP